MKHLLPPLLSALVGLGLSLHLVSVSAADVAAGRTKAQSCTVCHGALGVSNVPDAPHLAGQPALYVSNQLRAFRSGERRHEVMGLIAKPLTDADIDDLAAWFSAHKVDVRAPG